MIKRIILGLGILGSANAFACISDQELILNCTASGTAIGGPSYQVMADTTGSEWQYYIQQTPMNPTVKPVKVMIGTNPDIIRYGDAFILTANAGRSGFAHIYAYLKDGAQKAIIDINLFQNKTLNTNGPLTFYTCEEPVAVNLCGK